MSKKHTIALNNSINYLKQRRGINKNEPVPKLPKIKIPSSLRDNKNFQSHFPKEAYIIKKI